MKEKSPRPEKGRKHPMTKPDPVIESPADEAERKAKEQQKKARKWEILEEIKRKLGIKTR